MNCKRKAVYAWMGWDHDHDRMAVLWNKADFNDPKGRPISRPTKRPMLVDVLEAPLDEIRIKVRTKRGKVGWVFYGCLHFERTFAEKNGGER